MTVGDVPINLITLLASWLVEEAFRPVELMPERLECTVSTSRVNVRKT
jgi:hypothetical protein